MNIEEILTKTLENGGITINTNREELKKKEGYMVGGLTIEYVIDYREPYETMKLMFDTMISIIRDEMEEQNVEGENAFIGAWVENNEKIVLEGSEWIEDYNNAIKIAKRRDQKAIFDLYNETTIYVLNSY